MSEGSMGIAAGDYDSDGDDDIFIAHWDNKTNTLYRKDAVVVATWSAEALFATTY